MRLFDVSVSFNRPYPVTKKYQIQAGGFSAAAGQALRKWKKEEVKRKRIKEVTLKIITV